MKFNLNNELIRLRLMLATLFLGLLSGCIFLLFISWGAFLTTTTFFYSAFILGLSPTAWFIIVILGNLLVLTVSFSFRGFLVWLKRFFIAKRVDLFVLYITGITLAIVFSPMYIWQFERAILSFDATQFLMISLVLPLFYFALVMRLYQLKPKPSLAPPSYFVSDQAIHDSEDDAFDYKEKAETFAEHVFNMGNPESLVFGIDAPWGAGKSSFINLCSQYWFKIHKDKVIVFTFEPLRYESHDKLLRKFIDGLVAEINKHVFLPELTVLSKRYKRIIASPDLSFSLFGINFSFPSSTDSIDDVFEALKQILLLVDRRIVVVFDDLDRLEFSKIKDILFAIKKAFVLPNVSYILCYDTDNLKRTQANSDAETVIEFLEKFINIKFSIYLDDHTLLDYFTEKMQTSTAENLLADPKLVANVIDGLKEIFNSSEFDRYLALVGDARKIKRLINTVLVLEIQKIDYKPIDIDKLDLIHLLLLYTNYPAIFRKIYYAETSQRYGFFSLKYEFSTGHDDLSGYKNSKQFLDYLKKIKDSNASFILRKIFDVNSRFPDASDGFIPSSKISKNMETSYACFNGNGWGGQGRNLEDYLKLITTAKQPVLTTQYKFFLSKRDKILEVPISDVFYSADLDRSKGEAVHEQLWRVLVNTEPEKFVPPKSDEVIDFAVDILPTYSLLEIEKLDVGFRDDLVYFLTRLLDRIGWTDEVGQHSGHNYDENVVKLAARIFGDGHFQDNGILERLTSEERGVLGFYDLLVFRLYCCTDRGGDIFNLSRAIAFHASPDAPTSGNTRLILIEEMREISQIVFNLFKLRYIDQNQNIFSVIDQVTLQDVCGDSLGYIQTRETPDKLEERLSTLKSRMKAFIIYQLGNDFIDHGIGCGFYNLSGIESEDSKSGIRRAMNDYLFENCFNGTADEVNYTIFLDYLLINFSYRYRSFENERWVPNLNELIKVLDKDRLMQYWRDNANAIKAKNYQDLEHLVRTGNYTANYADDLETVYEVLDRALQDDEGPVE